MSRKGKYPIQLPKGVEVKIAGLEVSVKGPKGTLSLTIDPSIDLKIGDTEVLVQSEEAVGKAHLHGLYRSLVENMIIGSSQGFQKQLELKGVGYRAQVKGKEVHLQLGFSHPLVLTIPEGLEVKVEKSLVTVSGIEKQKVGQFAAVIRSYRPPEPYKGSGVRYVGEFVRRKAGKTAAKK